MENNKYYISKICKIENESILLNDNLIFRSELSDFPNFSKSAYKYLNIEYPKFFKMDAQSKLAILGAEVLLENEEYEKPNTEIALLFSNYSSSLETDLKHQESIKDHESFYPSPSIFVYTLANICLAEVSIKHKLQSENAFFVFEKYDTDTMYNYAEYLLQTHKAEKVICGWTEYFNDSYQLILYLVEKEGIEEHSINNINKIFT